MINGDFQSQITEKINLFRDLASQLPNLNAGYSTIQTLLFNNSMKAKNAATSLQKAGFDVRAILSPTVPRGKERLRICLHTYNTDQEIIELVGLLKTINYE